MDQVIPKIVLGTVQFGLSYGIGNSAGQTSEKEVSEILSLAKSNGVDTLDTAYLYGNSESVLGHTTNGSFKVISKFPDVQSVHQLHESLSISLKRLGVESLYGYMAHRSESLKKHGIWETLHELKQNGKVKKIGYSLYNTGELANLLDNGMFPDLIQVPFNILDQRFRHQLIDLHSKGVEIHARSAFLQGLFFQPIEALGSFFDEVKPFLKNLNHKFVNNNVKANALLSFCVQQPMIDKVVIGVNNAEQLKANLDALNERATPLNIEIPELSELILQPSNWPKQ